ncbi:MAG TPA: hypothetical protein PKD64_02695 [Pirellulaceae bacterium]|nr:hypothetical protein [Pirellulaceae bacterium]HMO91078.1 hypothetical protein [Pirellulaceae bacterium]HMP68192.1 hypothetical protein [Pirellulaceae bacterium]
MVAIYEHIGVFFRFVLFAVCLLTGGFLAGGKCFALENNDAYVAELKRYDRQYIDRGFDCTISYIYLSGPAWPANTVFRTERCRVKNWGGEYWISEMKVKTDHFYYQLDARPEAIELVNAGEVPRNIEREMMNVLGPNFLLISDGLLSRTPRAFGYIKSTGSYPLPPLSNLWLLFGFDEVLANLHIPYSTMLTKTIDAPTRVALDGINTMMMKCLTECGTYHFSFREHDAQLLQIEILRGPDDYQRVVGSRKYRVRETETKNRESTAAKLQHEQYRYHSLQYQEIDGERFCVGFVCDYSARCVNNLVDEVRIEVSIENIQHVDIDERPKRGEMKPSLVRKVPNGARFQAMDEPMIPYVVHQGMVHKVVNESTLATLEDGTRFPWPRGGVSVYSVAVAVLALLALLGLIIYRFRKHAGQM